MLQTNRSVCNHGLTWTGWRAVDTYPNHTVCRFVGESRAGWRWWTGSGPGSPRRGTRWSAGGAGRILTAAILHCSYTRLFNMWELLKELNFPHVLFCSRQDWAQEANSKIEAPSFFVFLSFCLLFDVCDFWWTAVGGLWWRPPPADRIRRSEEFPRTVAVKSQFKS